MRLIMKITKSLQITIMLGMTMFAGTALAYGTNSSDNGCKKPKFRTFEPEHLSEVDPETTISFHVSNWADPTTIKAETRKIPLQLKIIDKMNFFVATAKMPASIIGKYARIHVRAKAKEGGCTGKDGWLLKVREAAAEPNVPAEAEVEKETLEKADK